MRSLSNRGSARAFDRRVIDAGVPGLLLMENAGRGATDVLLRRFAGRLARPIVLGGTGQNGGDAWVVARRLLTMGIVPRVFLVGDRASVAGDARVNLDALDAIDPGATGSGAVGLDVVEVGAGLLDPLFDALNDATVVVDGLFGTGLDRPLEGWRREVVERVDACPAPVFALDLPSGVDADTGAVLGAALHAEVTVTFASHKRGLWQSPGREHAGHVVCVDIGVPGPRPRLTGGGDDAVLLELSDTADWLPSRAVHAHKGVAGHVLVVAGAPGTTGAAILCGHGAMRAGAGLVTLAARGSARDALDRKVVELMTAALPDLCTAEAARALARGKASAAIGPGLGLDEAGRALAVDLATTLPLPTVLDADALTAIADAGPARLRDAVSPRVLTPHPGEAGRLLGLTNAEVQADRYAAATRLAVQTGQVVVLKGAGTVVAGPDGRLAVCPLGTPALAVAGTGDVLAGVIAAVLATVGDPFSAACAGVVLHARAGELAAIGDRGLLAREVADHIPAALHEARR